MIEFIFIAFFFPTLSRLINYLGKDFSEVCDFGKALWECERSRGRKLLFLMSFNVGKKSFLLSRNEEIKLDKVKSFLLEKKKNTFVSIYFNFEAKRLGEEKK